MTGQRCVNIWMAKKETISTVFTLISIIIRVKERETASSLNWMMAKTKFVASFGGQKQLGRIQDVVMKTGNGGGGRGMPLL